jgi:hypothetical protein
LLWLCKVPHKGSPLVIPLSPQMISDTSCK